MSYPDESSSPMRTSIVVPVLALTVLLAIMNTTMFNVALPQIAQAFHMSGASLSWIVSGYSIIYAIASITYSRLADFRSPRTLLAICLACFGIGSILGSLSGGAAMLLGARLLQGAGAGGVKGLALLLIARHLPAAQRGRAIALIVASTSLAFGLGPLAGGIFAQFGGWRTLFFMTAIVLVLIPALLRLLPHEPTRPGRFDGLGALLIGGG
ncbi:MFS transporter, partial [Paenibacillus sp. 598K]|uniref:MFS transporter n=1 Tax=Paenibacillus sp. 598K TaxID=1117987 RepID=UPI00162709C4